MFDLSGFDLGIDVGLSISETADVLGFSNTAVFRVYTEWCDESRFKLTGSL